MTDQATATFPFSSFDWIDASDFRDEVSECIGWSALLRELLIDIDGALAGRPTKMRLLQVKEKLGELRFYYRLDGAEDAIATRIDELVQESKRASRSTCIRCGADASIVEMRGWIAPMCKEHADTPKFRFRKL